MALKPFENTRVFLTLNKCEDNVSKHLVFLIPDTQNMHKHIVFLNMRKDDVSKHLVFLLGCTQNMQKHIVFLNMRKDNV